MRLTDYRTVLDDHRLTRRESPQTSMRRLRCPLQIFKPLANDRERWGGRSDGGGEGGTCVARIRLAEPPPLDRRDATRRVANCACSGRVDSYARIPHAAEAASICRISRGTATTRRRAVRLGSMPFGAPCDDFFFCCAH